MFDFLKRKKEAEFDFSTVESTDEVKDLGNTLTPGLPNRQNEIAKPEIFASPDQKGVVTERDIQLILTKMELLNKKVEDMDNKLTEILEIAKQAK